MPKTQVAGRNKVEILTWQKRVSRMCLVPRLRVQSGWLNSRSERLILERGFCE